MGLKYPAALRRPHRERFLLVTATAALLLYITVTVTVLQDASLPCRSSWAPCRRADSPQEQPGPPAEADAVRRDPPLSPCPGHRFQVSQLLSHLHSALGPDGDVLLQPYLSSWDELLKFMESLGPVAGFISQQVEHKASVIRRLAQREEAAEGDAYRSVRSMIGAELSRGLVSFRQQTPSGCRTLLRLHRALLWLQLFLKKVAEGPQEGGELRSPSSLCREAYREALAHHHSWLARRAADVAFMALPDRDALFQLVCARSQGEAGPLLDRAAEAIGEVYGRTQKAFEEHGMLELP
ncbi:ceramide-1-phosphate transfer protein isoform X2 [Scleropages formosus]|uniref:ceramide-1-phosphate transfer protein isoform X2 n=1 Tax=Scleropages formosus TaxID=113540 RepID=UPI0010FA9107|nr:ceramide-1-phosphate transfer protein-like isoform X2 [Scleropages formosus]